MKIVLLDALTLADVDFEPLQSLGELKIYETTDNEQKYARCKDADVIITNKVIIDQALIDSCPKLRLITITATGMNNVDLEYAKAKEIAVKNAVGYSTHSVTQLTFSIALYLLNQMEYYDTYGKNEWKQSPVFTHLHKPFWELYGKKWGIVGLGTIGKSVASVASAFGCEVLYYSTSGQNHDDTYAQVSLEELLQMCDIISVHSPLNEKTKNLINGGNLSLIKDGGILLNLGRGGIVNEQEVATEIDFRPLMYGADVTSSEPIPADSPLLNVEKKHRLCITPHVAWGSIEARERLMQITYQNVKEFIDAN